MEIPYLEGVYMILDEHVSFLINGRFSSYKKGSGYPANKRTSVANITLIHLTNIIMLKERVNQ